MKAGQPKSTLVANNLSCVQADFKDYKPPSKYAPLVELLADCADTAINGTECYITFGISRDKSSILLTVHYNHSTLYASGATLEGVASEGRKLY